MSLDYLLMSQMSDTDYSNNGSVTTSNALKGRGKLLVTGKYYNPIKIWPIVDNTVSADGEVRDQIRSLVKESVQDSVRFMELEFQPQAQRKPWSMFRHR